MQMFQSATLKLTLWYLAILMVISLTFSVVIYQLNFKEVSYRLENLQHSLIDENTYSTPSNNILFNYGPNSALSIQSAQASAKMIVSLLYINVVVLIAGGCTV